MHIIKYRRIHNKTSHSDMVKSASTIQNGNFNHALLTLVLRTVSTLEFSGLYVICMRGIKGSSWLVKLFPKSSEIKIREPWPPDTSAVRITCKPESKIHSPSKTRMMEMKNLAHVPSTYFIGIHTMRKWHTFPEFSGLMAIPNSDLINVLLMRSVTSSNDFP